ncbi:MAG: hypothetical protein U0W40_01375 [Acidimicrobiia bacterium]
MTTGWNVRKSGAQLLAVLLTVVAATAGFSTTSASAESGVPASDSDAATVASLDQVLAVVDAAGGRFDGRQLTLTGVRPQAVWFSDRPAREAGRLPVADLEQAFFARQTPPNAALVVDGASGARDVVVVELSKPRYDARSRTLRFVAEPVKADDVLRAVHPRLAALADRADDQVTGKFGEASLFVDSTPAATLTPDQATVDQLVSEFQTESREWGKAILYYRNCWDTTHQQLFYEILLNVADNFRTWNQSQQELVLTIQPAVNQTGTLTPEQQQELVSIAAANTTGQQFLDPYMPIVDRGTCT